MSADAGDDLDIVMVPGDDPNVLRESSMPWYYLAAAGLLEIGWAVGLKSTDGFTRPLPTLFTVLAMVASVTLLAIAIRSIPVGVAYAVWTGIGAVGTVIVAAFLGESLTPLQWGCVAMIVSGVIGLKLLASA